MSIFDEMNEIMFLNKRLGDMLADGSPAEMFRCQSYYDDDNSLQDCSCGRCARAIEVQFIESVPFSVRVKARIKELYELEETAPFGRCRLCNLALTEVDTKYKAVRDMHIACAEDFYE